MMHRCSSSQGNMVGPCSCDLYHYHHNQYHHHHHHHQYSYSSSSSSPPSSSPFSMVFSKPYDQDHRNELYDQDQSSTMIDAYTSAAVDCTLSLGTPSTRLCSNDDVYEEKRSVVSGKRRSNLCWDLLQPKTTSSNHKNNNNNNNNSNNSNNNNSDPLVARRCANCDTTSTPLWRNGPRGPKSLCNACGIRFKKEERRASAAAAATTPATATSIDHHHPSSHVYGHQYHHGSSNMNQWNNFSHSQSQKLFNSTNNNEFRFMESSVDGEDSDTGISFLSWRLNVTDRPSFVHDFTR